MADNKPVASPPVPKKRKAHSDETLLLYVIKKYFKYAGAALAIWGFGYFNCSPAWILLGLVIVVWKEKHNKEQQRKIEISQQAAKNEKEAILARVEDLPSWVFFPDIERAEWLNKMLDQMWPYIGDYVQNLLMTSVQKSVQDSASMMGSFKFVNIDLGDIPPRIGGVKVYTDNVKRDEIYMDLDIIYSSDCEIEVKLKGMTAGIKDLQLHGDLRVIFKPLISQSPFFGGMSVFFLNNPTLDFNLTNMANALDLPGLNDMMQTMIQEQIANIMVLPNRIAIEMAKGLDVTRLRYPQPHGVLRIHVIEAVDLEKADISVLGKGKSDPYAVIRVGAQKFKTHVLNNTLAPVWNCVYETVIDERDGQFMDIEVRDEDPGSKDDKLGTVSLDLSPVCEKGTVDSWLPLENVKTGKIHLKLVWLYLSKDPVKLTKPVLSEAEKKSIESNKKEKRQVEDLSSCILMVNLDSARELPRSKKLSEPNPFVEMNVGQKSETSKIVYETTDPRFEQGFRFLVNDPNFQTLELKVMDEKTDKCMGEVSYPLKNLLSAPDLVVDQYFRLKKQDGQAEIQMRLALRVLTKERSEDWQEQTENLMTKEVNTDAKETDVDQATTDAKKPAEKPASAAPETVKSQSEKEVKPEPSQPIPPAKTPDKSESQVRQRQTSTSSTNTLGEHRLGRIQLTLRYSNAKGGKLVVCVHKCVSLLACDKDNFSDPYVNMYLLPEKSSSSKRKTKIINNNLNPVFDETFEYELTPQDLHRKGLEVTVKNDTSMFSSSQKVLGVVVIDLSKINTSQPITEWYDLCPDEEMKKKETDI